MLRAALGPSIDLLVWILKYIGAQEAAGMRPLQLPTCFRRLFGSILVNWLAPEIEPRLCGDQAARRGGTAEPTLPGPSATSLRTFRLSSPRRVTCGGGLLVGLDRAATLRPSRRTHHRTPGALGPFLPTSPRRSNACPWPGTPRRLPGGDSLCGSKGACSPSSWDAPSRPWSAAALARSGTFRAL